MRTLMKKYLVLILIPLLGACENMSKQTSLFGVTNESKNKIQLIVQNTAAGPEIPGPGAARFKVGVLMRTSSEPTAPSITESVVNVSVAAFNVESHEMSPTINCVAGPKVLTSVTYRKDGYIWCTWY